MDSLKKEKMLIASINLSLVIITAPLANLAYSQQPGQMGSNSSIILITIQMQLQMHATKHTRYTCKESSRG